jgi:hypothetical protein
MYLYRLYSVAQYVKEFTLAENRRFFLGLMQANLRDRELQAMEDKSKVHMRVLAQR